MTPLPHTPSQSSRWLWFAPLIIVGITIGVLYAMGRPVISASGTIQFWHGASNTAEDSQHIADWYSFSHVIHGFLLYWVLWMCACKAKWMRPKPARFAVAVFFESAWEVLENTPLIINRYREATIALGYNGDSILNSTCDIVFMSLGFLLAMRFPIWLTICIAVAFEVVTALIIRDNLSLNVLMLVFPIDAVHQWQVG